MTNWEIKGREFGNCNCSYGCPCQFNALPTHGHCRGARRVRHRDGLSRHDPARRLAAAAIFRWPGPIHEGKGEGVHVVDQRATPEQREALLRILQRRGYRAGGHSVPDFLRRPATRCMSRSSPTSTSSSISTAAPRARAIEGVVEMRGAPILNPVTGAEHRVRIEQPNGFEFAVGRDRPRLVEDERSGQLRARRYLRPVCQHPSLPERHRPLTAHD